jgi:hypothetical protein
MEREGKAARGRASSGSSCVCVLCESFFLCFADCRVGAPRTAKLSPPQNSADDGPPREMNACETSSR